MHTMLEEAATLAPQLKAMKDDLHRHPELSYQELRTTQVLKKALSALDLDLIDLGMETGVVALLRGGRPGKTVVLRADIDALPYDEPADAPVRSEHPGRMHACGHDFHTAGLYGAARLLCPRRETLAGNVVFLFQPAEEATSGAQAMITHGLYDKLPARPDCFFSLHNRPELPAGDIAVVDGPLMAGKSSFHLTFRGVAGHGGTPHRCVDVLVAAAAFIQGVQTIVSRNTDPMEPLVCGVCSIHGGEPELITDQVAMTGSIRAHAHAVMAMAQRRVEELAHHIAQAYGCTADLRMIPQVPVTANHPALTPIARRAAAAVVGAEHVVSYPPVLSSEDFSVYGETAPAFFYFLGVGFPGGKNAGWHSPHFRTNDDALSLAAALLAQSALEALAD